MARGAEIGRIVRLQVQTTSLKVPGHRFRAYDPTGIRAVPSLLLDDGGVAGLDDDGDRVADVHHRDHPASKFRGDNGISVGFTSHYAAMRARFPGALGDGEAGENILVETRRTWSEDDLAGGIEVVTERGVVVLAPVVVAEPCVEFARHLLDWPRDARPDRTVSDAVGFLGKGVRGFYAQAGDGRSRIDLGDRVFVRRLG
jgi:hypothetical protein